jgi:hypothetical protein
MSRLGADCCHKGHAVCCHCGAPFKPAPDERHGSDCDCPSFAADLHGGPCDGQRWWVPQALVLHYRPRLSFTAAGRGYLLARVSNSRGGLTFHYEWDASATGNAAGEHEAAREGSPA